MNARDGNGARRALEEHDGACTIGGEYGAGGDACKRDDHSGYWRTRLRCKDDRFCAGFRTPMLMSELRADAGGVRKTPRHEIAVEHVTAVPRALWGFGRRG